MPVNEKTNSVFTYLLEPIIGFWHTTTDLEQIHDVCDAYSSLRASTTSDEEARDVYDALITTALVEDKPQPVNWLLSELRFEAFAAATGDRRWAALMELEHGTQEINDKHLDLYNERINRVFDS